MNDIFRGFNIKSCIHSVFYIRFSFGFKQSVIERPSPITKREAIIMTVGLLKPLNVSDMERTPNRKRDTIESNATTSGENLPHKKRRIVILKIINVVVILTFIL